MLYSSDKPAQEAAPVIAYDLEWQYVVPFKGPEVMTGGPLELTA